MDGPADVFIWKVTAVGLHIHTKKEVIESPIFEGDDLEKGCVDGTQWQLVFYPLGDDSPGHISLFLKRVDTNAGPVTFSAQFRLSLVDCDGADHFDVCCKGDFERGTILGRKKMAPTKDIFVGQKSLLSVGTTLTFKCQVRRCDPFVNMPPSLSVSRTRIYTESAKFYWQLEKFSGVSEDCRASTTFSISKHLLRISCYPAECDGQLKLMVDIQLMDPLSSEESESSSGSEGSEASFNSEESLSQSFEDDGPLFLKAKISLVDSTGMIRILRIGEHLFSEDGDTLHLKALVPMRSIFRAPSYFLPDDVLTLRFDVRAADGRLESNSEGSQTPLPAHKLEGGTTLLQDIVGQESAMLFPDIGLVVNGEIFQAHKSILAARSSVFRLILKDWQEELKKVKNDAKGTDQKKEVNETTDAVPFIPDEKYFSSSKGMRRTCKKFVKDQKREEERSLQEHENILNMRDEFMRGNIGLMQAFNKSEVDNENQEQRRSDNLNVMAMHDFDKGTMKRFLKFLYTDTVDSFVDFDSGFLLYYAAAKYDIPLLKAKCLSELKPKVTTDRAVRALILAIDFEDEALRSTAEKLIHQDKDVLGTRDWSAFERFHKEKADHLRKELSGEMPKIKRRPLQCNIIVGSG